MPGDLNLQPTRITVITDAYAKPRNSDELATAFQQVVGALRGAWGTGNWTGEVEGVGYWCKHSQFWDAKLSYVGTGTQVVSFPFKVTESIVKVYKFTGTTASLEANYVQSGSTLSVTHVGPVIIELQLVKVVK